MRSGACKSRLLRLLSRPEPQRDREQRGQDPRVADERGQCATRQAQCPATACAPPCSGPLHMLPLSGTVPA